MFAIQTFIMWISRGKERTQERHRAAHAYWSQIPTAWDATSRLNSVRLQGIDA